MSKQSSAKQAQGYVAKAVPRVCVNCLNFKMDITERKGKYAFDADVVYKDESNLRCGIGGFAVKKMATCNLYAAAEAKP